MKFTLSFLILFFYSTLHCQTYSNEISDNEISVFFQQLKNSKKLKIKKIDQKIIKWSDYDVYGEKDSTLSFSFGIGLLKNEIVLKHLTKDDIKYIEKQYISIRDSVWRKNEFKKFNLLDSLGRKEIHEYSMKRHRKMGNYYSYSFSIPLFSIDKKYVIIIKDFYCGFMCSTQCIYLYHRKEIFNNWEEIASWNCWST
jgi:hypothetical protein